MKNLFEAIADKNLDEVKSAIADGVDVNSRAPDGENKGATPLLVAVLSNSWESRPIIAELIKAGARKNDVVDAERDLVWTVLHHAANLGIESGTLALLIAGADPNIKDKQGRTPLHYASMAEHEHCIKYLILAGADPSLKAEVDGQTPATYAALKFGIKFADKIYTLEKNREANPEIFSFFAAIMKGDQAAFEAGIEKCKATQIEAGWTALMVASIAGRADMIEKLIIAGANIAAADREGANVLHWAAMTAQSEIMKLLVSKGANVNAPDTIGNTALVNSILVAGHTPTVEALLAAGANVNSRNNYGETPLYASVREYNRDIVACLLKAGADVKALTSEGGPITHSAARTSNPLIIEDIIKAGVDLRAAGSDGWQGIHVACEAGNLEAVKMFVKLGADVSAKTNDGRTPLDIAKDGGFDQIVDFLKDASPEK